MNQTPPIDLDATAGRLRDLGAEVDRLLASDQPIAAERRRRGLRNLDFTLRQIANSIDAASGEDPASARTLRNLRFLAERDRRRLSAAIGAAPLVARDDRDESPRGQSGERAEALDREATPDASAIDSNELTLMRRQIAALQGAVNREEADSQSTDSAAQILALRRQVAELQRSVSELRRAAPRRSRPFRRGGATATIAAPMAARRAKKRRVGLRRTIRVKRRKLSRVMRVGRARLRDRFFARRIGRLNHYEPRQLKLPGRYGRAITLSDPPTISIVTPSYNQGRFLGRTIRSVLDQSYPRLQYVVQDGGSNDSSVEILEAAADELHFWESGPDGGQGDAINRGFSHTDGQIMAYLNSDDTLLPGALAYVARYFQRHPEVDLVYGHRVLIDQADHDIGRWVLPRHNSDLLSWADFVPQETMFWRRSLWDRSGAAIDPNWKVALDWDLLLRFRDADAKVKRLPRFLGCFRVHDAQKTTAWLDQHLRAEMGKLRRRSIGHEPTAAEMRRAIRPYMRRHHVLQKLYRLKLLRP